MTTSLFSATLFYATAQIFMPLANASEVALEKSSISNCESVTLVRKNVGNAYKGSVTNDDYSMSLVIPKGLIGWGGVAEDAPFHGFTIFLEKADSSSACIVFDIHVRVNAEDKPVRLHSSHRIKIKNISGWQSINRIITKGEDIVVITTALSYTKAGDMIDSEITMIVPKLKYTEKKVIYDAFISSFKISATR